MVTLKETAMRMPKEYVSVSTRLPNSDLIDLENVCKREGTTPSEYIRDIILKNIHTPKKTFLSGKNNIAYDKTTNSFRWTVKLDSGQESEVLKHLSSDYLQDLTQQILEALKERNEWVHQKKDDSVPIPKDLSEKEK